MLDQDRVNQWCQVLSDRLTPEELITLLGVSVEDIFERFLDECLEINPEDVE